MLSRAFEWYRVVNVSPTSDTIESRQAAARDIVKAIDDADDWYLAFDCAAGAVVGFDVAFTQDSPVVTSLVSAIREHDSAFPADLSENALELRVTAALALGEILVRGGEKAPRNDANTIGAVLQSAFSVRLSPDGRHLRQMIDELIASAAKVRALGALSRRRRLSTFSRELEKLAEPADLPAAWKSLLPALKAALHEVAAQSTKDREEIDLLWWMFAGASTTTGQQLSEMRPGAAALCAGAELGEECLVPPTPSVEEMIRRAFEARRKPKDLSERSIETVAADWKGTLPNVLVPRDIDRELAQKYPSLFPLSWLCVRLIDSSGATGWVSEFEGRTRIPATHTCSSVDWAIQAFRERIALRLCGD